jgi:hypothetical protein
VERADPGVLPKLTTILEVEAMLVKFAKNIFSKFELLSFIYLFILLLKGLSCYTMDLKTSSGHVDCWMFVGLEN